MNNKIVARYRDGRVLKGTSLDIQPTRPTFHLRPELGPAVCIRMLDLKAAFFVRSLDGDASHQEALIPDPADARARGSMVVTLRFDDGEVMVGHAVTNPDQRPFFFIVPVDPESNNIRILVNRSAVVSVEASAAVLARA